MTKPLYKIIGEHIIDDMMMAGLSVLVLAFGFNYFNIMSSWTDAFSKLHVGQNLNFVEGSLILRSISNTFPFNLLTGNFNNFLVAMVVGLVLTLLGFALKMLTTRSKEKFIEDLGHELYVPAIFGFIGIVLLHAVTAFTLQNHVSDTLTLAARFNAGILIWKSFGGIFMVGLGSLLIGSLVLLVAKSNKFDKAVVIGRTLLNSSYVLIGYYVIIRLLGFQVVLDSPIGAFMKIFIVSGDVSNTVVIFTVFMFWLGRELKRYGKYLRVKKKYDGCEREEMERARARIRPVLPSPGVAPYYDDRFRR